MTTGMSAPPIGAVRSTPNIKVTPIKIKRRVWEEIFNSPVDMINSIANSKAINNKADKTNLWPNKISGLPEIISDNFPKATRLPENVIPPIKTVKEIAII